MAVTINEIAKLCGVSRGTVDRVLNNRGNVKAEKAEAIKKVASELGYKPNFAAKGLSAKKKSYVIGVIISAEGNPFFEEVIEGIKFKAKEIEDYGFSIIIKKMKGYSVEKQLELIDELKGTVKALILNPIMDRRIEGKIDELYENGIPVINVNTDVVNSKRICYVGSDYIKGGKLACGILGLLTNGKAEVGIITGSHKILGHNQRIDGFKEIVEYRYPELNIVDIKECNDDEDEAYKVTKEMLSKFTEIKGIYIVAAGVLGVCRAVIDMNLQSKMKIISFDTNIQTVDMMKAGIIKATIVQQPFVQGGKAVEIAFNYLVFNIIPDGNQFVIENEIKILESL